MKVLVLSSWPQPDQTKSGPCFGVYHVEALKGLTDATFVDVSHYRGPLPGSFKNFTRFLSVLLTQSKPDIIHCHTVYPATPVARKLAKIWKIPVVVTEHTGPLSLLYPYFGNSAGLGEAFKSVDQVIAVSQFQKVQILKCRPDIHVEVVGNIVHDRYLNTAFESKFDYDFGLFTRMTIEKGVAVFIDGLKKLNAKLSQNIKIGIKGDGPLGEELDSLNLSHIQISRFASGSVDENCKFIQSCRVLINPSLLETFGLVTTEAMALGKPCLATDCGGPADYFNSDCGILVKPGDSEALAEGALKMLTDRHWDFSDKAYNTRRQLIRTRFGKDVIASQLLKIYEGVIQNAQR